MYNKENIFYKILHKTIPAKIIYEDASILSFYDINPKSPVHALVIPKKECTDFTHFIEISSKSEIANFFATVDIISKEILHLKDFKIITNNGKKAGQEVFHFHVHIMGYL